MYKPARLLRSAGWLSAARPISNVVQAVMLLLSSSLSLVLVVTWYFIYRGAEESGWLALI